jgi:hypothetical protein
MWNMKCFVIPVIIGSTGIVTEGLKKPPSNNIKKAFNRVSTTHSCTRDIAPYKESDTGDVAGERKPVIKDDDVNVTD